MACLDSSLTLPFSINSKRSSIFLRSITCPRSPSKRMSSNLLINFVFSSFKPASNATLRSGNIASTSLVRLSTICFALPISVAFKASFIFSESNISLPKFPSGTKGALTYLSKALIIADLL